MAEYGQQAIEQGSSGPRDPEAPPWDQQLDEFEDAQADQDERDGWASDDCDYGD